MSHNQREEKRKKRRDWGRRTQMSILEGYTFVTDELDDPEGFVPMHMIDRAGRRVYILCIQFLSNVQEDWPPIWTAIAERALHEMIELGYNVKEDK